MALDPTLPVFAFAPDWGETLRERLEFRTDAIGARDGTEQTRSTRLTPRRRLEFTLQAGQAERQFLAALQWRFGAALWYLPIWPDGQPLAAALAAGSTSIPVDTTTRDYQAGGVAVLVGESARDAEAVEIASLTATALTLTGTTARTWPAGTMVYPARKARADDAFRATPFTDGHASGRVRFLVAEANPWPEAAAATTYRGYPVLTTRPNTVRDPETELTRRLEEHDDNVAIKTVLDTVGIPLYRQQHDFALDGRQALADFRGLAYALRGKRGSIWVPTWLSDLTVAAAVGAADLVLPVQWCGYSDYVEGLVNRQDLRIELRDGTVLYRRIASATAVSAEVEELTLDSAPGVAFGPDDVLQVSFMGLCRSDSDYFEFDWWTGEYAEVPVAWRGRQHDV
jgi:hypothetical protein